MVEAIMKNGWDKVTMPSSMRMLPVLMPRAKSLGMKRSPQSHWPWAQRLRWRQDCMKPTTFSS